MDDGREALRRGLAETPEVDPLDVLRDTAELVALLSGWQWQAMHAARLAGVSWEKIGVTVGSTEEACGRFVAARDRQETVLPGATLCYREVVWGVHSGARCWATRVAAGSGRNGHSAPERGVNVTYLPPQHPRNQAQWASVHVPGPRPPQWQPPREPLPEGNTVATAGFVIALIGLVIGLVPGLGIVAWLIAPVGLALSLVGLSRAPERRAGHGLAVAGIVLGGLGIVMAIIWTVVVAASTTISSTTPRQVPAAAGSAATAAPAAPAPIRAPRSAQVVPEPRPVDRWESGTWIVGDDIEPGRYRTDGAPEDTVFPLCSASRQKLDGTPLGFPEMTNNGPAYITVRASDGQVEFAGPCTWTRVAR